METASGSRKGGRSPPRRACQIPVRSRRPTLTTGAVKQRRGWVVRCPLTIPDPLSPPFDRVCKLGVAGSSPARSIVGNPTAKPLPVISTPRRAGAFVVCGSGRVAPTRSHAPLTASESLIGLSSHSGRNLGELNVRWIWLPGVPSVVERPGMRFKRLHRARPLGADLVGIVGGSVQPERRLLPLARCDKHWRIRLTRPPSEPLTDWGEMDRRDLCPIEELEKGEDLHLARRRRSSTGTAGEPTSGRPGACTMALEEPPEAHGQDDGLGVSPQRRGAPRDRPAR